MEKKKVIVYVDGYNFYYGLKNGKEKWRRVYWLDIVKFFEKMMQPDQELVDVHYYSARPLNDQQAYDNQDDFFCANHRTQSSNYIWADTRKRNSNAKIAASRMTHTRKRNPM